MESSLRDELDNAEHALNVLRSQIAVCEKGIKGRVVKWSTARVCEGSEMLAVNSPGAQGAARSRGSRGGGPAQAGGVG